MAQVSLKDKKQFAEDVPDQEEEKLLQTNGVDNNLNKAKKQKKKKHKQNKPSIQNGDMLEDNMNEDKIMQEGFKSELHKQLPMPNLQNLNIAECQDPQVVSKNLIQIADEENDSEDEGIEDYKIGGYHPVHIGEILQDRYVIMQKLGWGHFSTVWLARDFKYETYVALKIQKSAPHYLEAAYDEVEILQKVAKKAVSREWFDTLKTYYKDENIKEFTRDNCQVVQLLNSFIYRGPYGNHFCMVFEILGVNLLEIIKRYNYKGVPMHLCKILAKQILIGLDFLHRFCGVIHTDLKPENVLLCLTQEEIKEIVENGQLKQTMQYTQRIIDYQQQYGITPIQPQTLTDSTQATMRQTEMTIESMQQQQGAQQEQLQNENPDALYQGLTKKQKKQRKKKQAKKRKKQQMQGNQQQGDDLQNQPGPANQNQNEPGKQSKADPNEKQSQSNKKDDKNNQSGINGSQSKKQSNEMHHEKFHHQESNMFDNWNGRGSRLDTNVRVKIADLGNACWTHHHFATEIQTRQYRSPETILGIYYDTTADIWSFACMIFEMLTGDFLFEPRKGPTFGKDDDHLAQMEELLKKFSKTYKLSGRNSKKFYEQTGNLRRIPNLHNWSLLNVLIEKYRIREEEARTFNSLMLQMLHYNPLKRISAQKALDHPWFKQKGNKNYKYSEQDFNKYLQKKQLLSYDRVELSSNELPGSDINDADSETELLMSQKLEQKDQSDDEFYQLPKLPKLDIRFIDRSFTNLGYIGYGDGIEVEELDQTANWQFDDIMDLKSESQQQAR